MRKRLALLSLSFLLVLLAACGGKGWDSRQQIGKYNRFPGADWGMNPQEALASLGMNERDFTISTEDGLSLGAITWYQANQPQAVYGFPADVKLGFLEANESDKPYVGLYGAVVRFDAGVDLAALARAINDTLDYGKKDAKDLEAQIQAGKGLDWDTQGWTELPNEWKTKMQTAAEQMTGEKPHSPGTNQLSVITLRPPDQQTPKATLTFSGLWAAVLNNLAG